MSIFITSSGDTLVGHTENTSRCQRRRERKEGREGERERERGGGGLTETARQSEWRAKTLEGTKKKGKQGVTPDET